MRSFAAFRFKIAHVLSALLERSAGSRSDSARQQHRLSQDYRYIIPQSALVSYLATLPAPATAGRISYTLAEVGGRMDVRNDPSTSWPFGNDTANAQAGVQINGTPGGIFTGNTGNTPSWSGTLGANGTTLTASKNNGAGAPAPTAKSKTYYPFGFWAGGQKGGTIVIPTAGYFDVTKKTGRASAILTNTIGNATARGSATWAFVPGFLNNDWDGVEHSTVAMVNPAGAAIPANTRAVSDVDDPWFFYLGSLGTPLSFQVSLPNIQIDIAGSETSTDTGQFADAYYRWTVMLGAGETPGASILFSQTGGQDFSSLGDITLNPGTVVNYNNSSLKPGVYWMTADLTMGAELIATPTPEPASLTLFGIGAAALVGYARRRLRRVA
jgi:hypothetical protein